MVGKTLMVIFLDYTCCTQIVQSICNISGIANRKHNLNLKIFIEGGGVTVFGMGILVNFKMSYLPQFLRYEQTVSALNYSCCALSDGVQKL